MSHYQHILSRKKGSKVRINVAAHQNKTGKREAGEQERKQSTDFWEAACCPSAVVQRAARRKNGLYEGCARSDWDPGKNQQLFGPDPNGVGDRTTTLVLSSSDLT